MTSYLGFNVLEISPNAREAAEDPLHRSLAGFDPGLGERGIRARGPAPTTARPVLWTCQNRAAIAAMEAFLEAQRGRAVPFWLPSRRRDVLLAQPVGATDPGIVIQSMGYTRLLYPSKARRHLAFLNGASWIYQSVTAAVEGTATETLTMASPLGVSLPATTLVSQLLLCRLASDEVEVTYLTDSVAEAHLSCLEIPQEAP